MENRSKFYHAGFDTHLNVSGTEPLLDESSFKVLHLVENGTRVEHGNFRVYIGWCCLYALDLNASKLTYLSYVRPVPLPGCKDTSECNISPEDAKQIVDLQCGKSSTYILLSDGRVLFFDQANHDQKPANLLVGKSKVSEKVAIKISAGPDFVFILYESGFVEAFGNKFSNICMKSPDNEKFVSLACGSEHLLLLTTGGKVLSYGIGKKGQLGHGTVEDIVDDCRIIDALDGVEIKQISAGSWHSVALSSAGDIYAWGWNESGQLGIDGDSNGIIATPTLLNFASDPSFSIVSCGSRHSMAVSSDRTLFGWGWNKWKQVGIKTKQSFINMPLKVSQMKHISQLNCKYWSSIVETMN